MTSFLSLVAQDIIRRYGNDLSDTTIVFPNKRAALFLNEELMKHTTADAMWSPRYITISELFRQQSTLVVADHIKLICDLYYTYQKLSGTNETLDEFYSWGELLLSDFDDIDKNMAEASLVLENISNIHEFDNVNYLTDAQKETLKQFFDNFNDTDNSRLRKNFEVFWNKLYDIYTTFRQHLIENGIAYEGLLYRSVIEDGTLPATDSRRYIFIGFNLLHKVEQRLFEVLGRKDGCETHFYWDYDAYYMNNEAGKYIKEYMKHFHNDLEDQTIFNNFTKQKDITFVNAVTEDIQARYVSQWLTPERIAAGKRTAIVLCNEELLPTVINCLPEDVKHVNITGGYPLMLSPVSALVQQLLNMHIYGKSREKGRFRLPQINELLRHPYLRYVSPLCNELSQELNERHILFPSLDDIAKDENLRTLFAPVSKDDSNFALVEKLMWTIKTIAVNSKNEEAKTPLMQESLYKMYTLLSRLQSLIQDDGLDIDTMTFSNLLRQIIMTTTIPFHGEPIVGIQIMGVLETRNLDFDHVLMLSCNEGNLPKGVNDSSFIPHVIRKAYELTTVENKVAIYAYYFHRLLQRASDIQLTYNSSTDDGQAKEKSRFMLQMQAEYPSEIKSAVFHSDVTLQSPKSLCVEKSGRILEILDSIDHLSPSAFNKYLRCPLQFYFKYICKIDDYDDNDSYDTMDARVFGLVFHKAVEILYKPFINRTMTEGMIDTMLKDENMLQSAVNDAIKEELFRFSKEEIATRKLPTLNGSEEIQRKIILRLIKQMLSYDKRKAPINILGLEKKVEYPYVVNTQNGPHPLTIKGYIDRLDWIMEDDGQPQIRVIDYKTGTKNPEALASVEAVFDPAKIESHSDYFLQTMLYSSILSEDPAYQKRISPCLLYPAHARSENYDPTLQLGTNKGKAPIKDINIYKEEFKERLQALTSEIFNPTVPFEPTEKSDRCTKCFYKNICR